MAQDTFSGSVDDILEGIKKKQSGSAPKQNNVDDILAGLGIQDNAPPVQKTQAAPPRPQPPKQQPPVKPQPPKPPVQEKQPEPPAGPAPGQTEVFIPPVVRERDPDTVKQPVHDVEKDSQPTGTIQMDDQFQQFFSHSIAILNDEEPEQHPGFFARFLPHRPETADDDCEDTAEILIDSEPDSVPAEPDNTEQTREFTKAKEAPRRKKPALRFRAAEQPVSGEIELSAPADSEPAEGSAEKKPEKPFGDRLIRLFGSEKTEDGPFEEEEPQEYIDDYDNPEDAPHVEAELGKLRAGMILRVAVSAAFSILLIYMGLAVGDSVLPPLPGLDPYTAPAAFLSVQLLLLLTVCAVNWRVFFKGVPGIWKTPTQDSMPALAAIAALLQLVFAVMDAEKFDSFGTTLFAGAASALLLFNAVGRLTMSGVVLRNFRMLSGGERTAAALINDRDITEKVVKDMKEPEPHLLVNRPAGLVKGFLRHSFSQRDSDGMAQKCSWLLLAVAAVSGLVSAFSGLGVQLSMAAFTGALCIGAPVAATLLSAVPSLLMQKSAARVGAVIPGWSAISQLGQANMLVAEAKDLFPSGCVRLHGIKTFEKQRIDLAILYTASVLIPGCDTLRDVFMEIIEGRTEILFPAENLENHPGRGFTAWVDNNRVIVGNRQMMQDQGVEIPSRDYESRYTKDKYLPIYLAVSGHVFGMFIVSYRRSKQVAETLAALRHQGVSVLVRSDDFCLKSNLLAQIYGLPQDVIKVLSAEERKVLAPLTRYAEKSEGCMSHLGSFSSIVGGMIAASGAAAGEHTASLVQTAGVVISCIMSLMLAFTGGIAQLSLGAVLLYGAVWGVLTLAMPLFRSY